MTATSPGPVGASPTRAILLGLISLISVAAVVMSLHTIMPTVLLARSTAIIDPSPVAPPHVVPPAAVLAAGSELRSGAWTVRVGKLRWGATAAVRRADDLNAQPSSGFEWVLLPVEVASSAEGVKTLSSLHVTLMVGEIAMSHRYKITHHYPSSKLPDELDTVGVAPGEARTGNVGWMIPTRARESGTCLIKVAVGDTSLIIACGSTN